MTAVKNTSTPDRRRRGRPRQFDRDQAVATALKIFKERGYEGTSVAHLTAAIGVSATSLYGAFPNKEELFEEAVALYQRTEAAFAALALDLAETTYAAVHDLLMEAAANYASDDQATGCLVSLGILSCGIEYGEIAGRTAARRIAAREAIKARLNRGKDSGELLSTTDPDAIAALYVTTV